MSSLKALGKEQGMQIVWNTDWMWGWTLTVLCFIIIASPPGIFFAQLNVPISDNMTHPFRCLDSPWRFPVKCYPMSHRFDLFQEAQIQPLTMCSYLIKNSSLSDNTKHWTDYLEVSFCSVSLSLSEPSSSAMPQTTGLKKWYLKKQHLQ